MMKRLVLLAAVLHGALAAPIASVAAPARIAVFDFQLIDTSLQGEMAGADPAHEARLRMIEAELRQGLEASGRFELVDTAPAAARDRSGRRAVELQRLRGRHRRQLDAELALVGWVQKVSNLILNINVRIRDTATREQVFVSSVDIRGDTDESWRHGIRYLLKNRLLKE